ncbi:MAG TPA: trypsin-like peptidase domain-containing protein [Thermomicrobiales bacterium]|nr:trypsin-like peptidase domain-containing protein [Thermomicrobiales bacterium]
MPRLRLFPLLAILFALVATPARLGSVAAQSAAATPVAALDAAAIARAVLPAVVTVLNEQSAAGPSSTPSPGAPGSSPQPLDSGSGFIIDQQGHVVTNAHVVAGGDTFQVTLQNGETRTAKLVGADPISDLAVIQIDPPVPATIRFDDSDNVQVGEWVLAIGSPLGDFTGTVTEGIVGAVGRDVPDQPGMAGYANLIQHDAAINPGNSGGPLVDANGAVIGVNTLGINKAPQVGPVQGLFFAIPSNAVQRIVHSLIATGHVVYPALGITKMDVTPDVAGQYGLPAPYGVYVMNVLPGSPADQAGVEAGDLITAIDGRAVDQQHSFTERLFTYQPGDKVKLTVLRLGGKLPLFHAGNTLTLTLTLGAR